MFCAMEYKLSFRNLTYNNTSNSGIDCINHEDGADILPNKVDRQC